MPARANPHHKLSAYRAKRDFEQTPEPSGSGRTSSSPAKAPVFVVQKHAASHLHYDFRLEWRGVLKSWAVPKGPSYDPDQKRLAIEVEDHPLLYGTFEGTIPSGQYGGGEVIVWDRGTWEPIGDADAGLSEGRLHFALHGEKLHGRWFLLRLPRKSGGKTKSDWLLRKERDGLERGRDAEDITDERPENVLSEATLQLDAKKKVAAPVGEQKPQRSREPHVPAKGAGNKAPREAMPSFVVPQLALPSTDAPSNSDDWVHEIKLDGYRIQAHLQARPQPRVTLFTRTQQDWTARLPSIVRALEPLARRSMILDGEVVVFSQNGQTSFADLQAAFANGGAHRLHYVVFDLLHLDGRNMRGLPLLVRKERLEEVMAGLREDGALRFSSHIQGDGRPVFAKACEIGAEGIVSKRADGSYVSGRSGNWLKHKCHEEQEFVVGGFTHPTNGSYGVGALLLGYYEGRRLIYAGRTGTGFTQRTHRSMRDRLEALKSTKMPFASHPAGATKNVIWVMPELVVQVSFANWTADKIVRQAAFKGIREDKPTRTIEREESTAPDSSTTEKAPPQKRKGRPGPSASEDLPIRLTHPEKVLDAASGLTKAMLARYYSAVAERMWPYVAGRPVTLVRCQGEGTKSCFYQRHFSGGLPDGVKSVMLKERRSGKQEEYLVLSSAQAIAELAQFSVLEIHTWGAPSDDPERADQITIDLDPDLEISWRVLANAAQEVRKRMTTAGLVPFLKSTGGKGLHVMAPITPQHEWPAVKEFAHRLVNAMQDANPDLYLTKMAKAARKGKIFLDYLRNDRGATSIAPYSPRARAGASVAVPLPWTALDRRAYPSVSVATFGKWIATLGQDPWKSFGESARVLNVKN